MPVHFLGLHGYKGSGKSTAKTAVRRFVSELEKDVIRLMETNVVDISLADPLKDTCAAVFGAHPNWRGTLEQKEAKLPEHLQGLIAGVETFRQAMQYIGKLYRQNVGPDIWVALAKIRTQVTRTQYAIRDMPNILFICDDIRYENEANWLLAEGGAIVHIVKEGQVSTDNDSSEQILPDQFITKRLSFKTAKEIQMSAGYIYSLATGAAR